MKTFLILLIVADVVIGLVEYLLARRAPQGYQDADGFHYGHR